MIKPFIDVDGERFSCCPPAVSGEIQQREG
jgi:hypothetical protein